MKNAIIYLVVFLAIQIGAGMIVNASWMLISGESASDSAMGLIVTTVLSSVITIAVFLWLNGVRCQGTGSESAPG